MKKKHNIFLLFLLFSMSLLNATDIIDNKSDLPSDLEKYLRILLEEKETEIKKKAIETRNQKEREINLQMVNIPEKNYAIQQTEVTQTLYSKIMGELPTFFNEQGGNHPVVTVSLYDMVYFCNLLSTHVGLTPVYSVGGNTDVKTWNYTPHKGNAIKEEITLNEQASGYRLPTKEEWEYSARGGETFKFSGSNNIDDVAWYSGNTNSRNSHPKPVAQKKANGYGLFDMTGNVAEVCWALATYGSGEFCQFGGSYRDSKLFCELNNTLSPAKERWFWPDSSTSYDTGFRILRLAE